MAKRIKPTRPTRLFLKEWREHRGLTLEQVGDRLGVDRAVVQRYEANERKPLAEQLDDLAYALGCRPKDLLRPPSDNQDFFDDIPADVRDQAIAYAKGLLDGRK